MKTVVSVEASRVGGDISTLSWFGLLVSLTGRALINPALAVDLVRVAWRFRHRLWYRRFPFLPLPAMTYLRWRLYTAYGDETIVPPAADVIAFARWVGRQP
ncbi:MAG: hypothetical protein ABJC26_16255 [Gemmatimonadaceae bacterium]